MVDISLHVLDIIENAIRAEATIVEVILNEKRKENLLELVIRDNGKGMDEKAVENALDPFYTSKEGKRVGLGLPLLKQAAEETGGKMIVESSIGKGTTVTAFFVLDHPDLKPIGDMEGTIQLMQYAHSEISFVYLYKNDSNRKGDQK